MNRYLTRAIFTLTSITILSVQVALPRDPTAVDRPQLHSAPGQLSGNKARPFLRDVELTRLSMPAIEEEKSRLQSEYRKRWVQAFGGTVASVGAIALVIWFIKSFERGGASGGSTPTAQTMTQEAFNAREDVRREREAKRGPWNNSTILGSFAIGSFGIVATSFQRVFKLLAGTTEEVLLSIFRGYKGWFEQEEEMLQGTLLELRESLHRARNNQAGKEGSLYGASEQVTYYRSDVISQYEYVIWRFQNLIALMYLIAPKRNHAMLTNEVQEMIAYNETFAAHLEKDCNVNTHGFWTKYSAETLMMFHALTECMKEFVTRFKTKLRR